MAHDSHLGTSGSSFTERSFHGKDRHDSQARPAPVGRHPPGDLTKGGGDAPRYDGGSPADSPTDRLVFLAPGTVIGEGPPPGWSYLVAKSIPRLASGDLDTLPLSAAGTANRIRTAIVAEVREGRLRRIGVGICIPDAAGVDRVVSPGDPGAQGVALSRMARLVLAHAGRELERGRIASQTPTFAIFESPAALLAGGRHRKIMLRHALLAEAGGGLRCLSWAIDERTGERLSADLVESPPPCRFDCALDVSACRLLGTLPVSWSFAMRELPPGRHLSYPEGCDEGADAQAIERALRRAD